MQDEPKKKPSRKERKARAELLRKIFARKILEAYKKAADNGGTNYDGMAAMQREFDMLVKQKPQEANLVREALHLLKRTLIEVKGE